MNLFVAGICCSNAVVNVLEEHYNIAAWSGMAMVYLLASHFREKP